MSSNALDPPETPSSPPVDLLSGEADAEPAAAANTDSFTIDDDDDKNEGDDVITPLKDRSSSSGSQKAGKSGAKLAKLSDKTSKIMNDYQAYLQEIENEFPSSAVVTETHVDQVKDSIRTSYQEKFATPPPDLASMTKEYDAPSDMPLRRGWDHGDDEEEGSLNMRPHLQTRRKYTHPLLYSKKVKRALCMTLSVLTVVIISVSISNKKKANLPDWDGVDEGEAKGTQQQPDYSGNDLYKEQMSYQMSATTYHPVLFNRQRDGGYPDGSYPKAWEFCSTVDGFGLCPFAAVCPNGPTTKPILGVQEGGPSWNPVSDGNNEWVQLAEDGKCTLYSSQSSKPPSWGVSGGSTDETRNLMCCKQTGDEVPPPVATSTGSANTSNNALAIEFDRSKDWKGQTYGQAADFCGQKGYSICPFDVICPDGMNHAPATGLKPGSDGQWAPISDEIHDWVQVGTDIPCTRWLSRHPGPPAWSTTGVDNEEITRYIYCCPGSVYTAASDSAASFTTTTTTTTSTTTATTTKSTTPTNTVPTDVQNTQGDTNAAASVPEKGPPPFIQWFDRSKGYKGQTYTDAVLFCLDTVQAQLCTYSAICPDGQGKIPSGDYPPTSGESWVPIKESEEMEDDNAWISVSSANLCTRYDRLHPAPPVWGDSGEGNEEITRNVACCHESQPPMIQSAPNTDSIPTPDTTTKPELTPNPTPVDYHKIAKETYDPVWFHRDSGWGGQTYSSAQQFCSSKSRVLCPIPAVCPQQPGAEDIPIDGIKGGVNWIPLDQDNQWVQVGPEDTCILYADLFDRPGPDWGLTGEDNESITRHIVCCRDESSTVPSDSLPHGSFLDQPVDGTQSSTEVVSEPPPSTTEVVSEPPPSTTEVVSEPLAPPSAEIVDKWDKLAIEVYAPQWYTSKEGYTPSTYNNAQSFCEKNGQILCPLVAYCPTGSSMVEGGRSPLLMEKEIFPGDVWAPAVGGDEVLDYVQLGTFSDFEYTTCQTLTSMNGGKLPSDLPELGDVVLCCTDEEHQNQVPSQVDGGQGSSTSDSVSVPADSSTPYSNSIVPPSAPNSNSIPADSGNLDLSDPVIAAGYKYEPFWVGRDHGWNGGSYDDAKALCVSFEANLCPYQAYCPLGASKPVMPGMPADFSFDEEHYAPVAKVDNAWVNVGKKDGDPASTCRGYDQLYVNQPIWGHNSQSKTMKRYILCCAGESA